ncbi:PIR Superfamily Protein [Plasmodium malariae]|uniref:PIR Superfamily Protein n=1 Tax=Plasmodium malariae TaxID=5858 RepID=A0A1A8X0M7_PLAMA|nr:PIR Superfamily Protein [Plasmodium malariae]
MEKTSEEILFNIQNKILKGSQSSDIYNILNENVTDTLYKESCQKLKNMENDSGEHLYELCRKILRNAKSLSERYNMRGYNDLCSHYRYWVYYKLKEILRDKMENNNLKSIIDEFSEARKSITDTYNAQFCKFEVKENALQELKDMLEEKYLFDYFENYDTIRTPSACEHANFEKYKEYLSGIIELYNKHKKEKKCCEHPFWPDCPHYFKCETEFDPNTLLYTLNSNAYDKCNNLKKLEKTTNSGYPMDSGGSRRDIIGSFYITSCIYIKDNIPKDKTLQGARHICNVFSASPKSLNHPASPYYNSFYRVQRTTRVNKEESRDIQTRSEMTRSVQSTGNANQLPVSALARQPQGVMKGLAPTSTKSSTINNQLASLESLNRKEDKITDKQQECSEPGLVKGISGECREPSVRDTLMIGAKWNTYAPYARVKYSPESISVLLRNSDKSNIFSNNIFRVGIAFTLIVGIISTIYIYYKVNLYS